MAPPDRPWRRRRQWCPARRPTRLLEATFAANGGSASRDDGGLSTRRGALLSVDLCRVVLYAATDLPLDDASPLPVTTLTHPPLPRRLLQSRPRPSPSTFWR